MRADDSSRRGAPPNRLAKHPNVDYGLGFCASPDLKDWHIIDDEIRFLLTEERQSPGYA